MSEFTRGFRLHQRQGPVLDGAAFPSGRVFVIDDPEHGLATAAVSIEELLRGGYDGARVEWGGCAGCREYLDLKRRAESPEAAAAPLREASDRPEPTLRERIAAALFEQHIRKPWAMAYPADIESYLADTDAFLAVRDAEMKQLRDTVERVRAIHRPASYRHTQICIACSGYDGSSCDNGMHEWPCATAEALDRPRSAEASSPDSLPPAQPCTDPRHTGPIREQLGCSGPDPATA